ncbi:rac GTPase-activating protein 1 [Sarcoptes scabiei]|nr:rac GTPase-activating protein 1 [Sarcoptes scabiei]
MNNEEANFRESVRKYLIDSGERERMIQKLNEKLKSSNWNDKVIKCCWDVMNEIGNEQLSVDILVDKISPKAKEMIPIEVKNEMIDLIQNALMSEFNIN